jgi:hypothetical protein
LAALCALGACQPKQKAPEENLIVDGGNIPANADIEALPPDESSGTSTEELANGADNPDVNDVNASGSQTNSY